MYAKLKCSTLVTTIRMIGLWQHFFDNENHANFLLPEGGRAVETVDEPEAASDTLLPDLERLLR